MKSLIFGLVWLAVFYSILNFVVSSMPNPVFIYIYIIWFVSQIVWIFNKNEPELICLKTFDGFKYCYCHVVSHWDDRNKITTIIVFELASHQRMTVKTIIGIWVNPKVTNPSQNGKTDVCTWWPDGKRMGYGGDI